MLELLEKVSKVVSEFGIGVVLIDKYRKIRWANQSILKSYNLEDGLIGKECGVIFKNLSACGKVLNSAFLLNEIERVTIQCNFCDNNIRYCRTIFIPVSEGSNEVEYVIALLLNLSEQERSAYEILELNKFLSNVVHNSADAIISLDREGKIKSWNKGAETIFEYKKDEVIGKKLDFLLPKNLIEEKELEWIEETVLDDDAIVNYEAERITKSGKRIVANVTRTLLREENNEIVGYSEIIKDITDRKRIEEELKNTIEQLSKLNEIAEFIHGTHNENEILNLMLTGVTAGEGFRFNRAFLFIYNEEKMILEGRSAIGPSNPEEAGIIWHSLGKAHSLKDVLNIYKDNVDNTDIAIKKIVKNIKIPISDVNNILVKSFKTAQHFLIEKERTTEPGALNLLQTLNTDHFIVVPLIGKYKTIGVLVVDYAITKKKMHEEEIGLLRLFAHQSSLAIENAKLYESLEEKLQLLKETYDNLEKSQEKVMHYEKLATIGQVTAKIAHEIRNPLVSIGGFANLLKKNLERGNIDFENVNIIIDEVARLEKILSNIVSFTKQKHISEKKFGNINETMEKTIKIMAGEFSSNNILVEKLLSTDVPKLYYDEWEISQVFINLFRNAIHAMNSKGTLFLSSYVYYDTVKIEIEDTGSGIPEDMFENIFDPFFTTKSYGMGLGLSICKQILSDHNCNIDIKSELNKGTTFTISFPIEKTIN